MRISYTVCAIGLFALLVSCTSAAEREARQRWYDSLTPEQQVRLEQQRMQAVGMFLGGGGFQSFRPLPPQYQSIPLPAPVYRPPVTCQSNLIGQQMYTNCQ